MPGNVPAEVWWFVIKISIAICAFIGALIILIFWRTGKLPSFNGGSKTEKSKPPFERRTNDVIIAKLVDALVEGGRKIADEMHELSSAIREQTKSTNEGFRDLDRKVEALAKGKSHGHPETY